MSAPDFEADRDRALVEMWRATGQLPQICWYFGVTEAEAARIVSGAQRRRELPRFADIRALKLQLAGRRRDDLLPTVTTPALRARLKARK